MEKRFRMIGYVAAFLLFTGIVFAQMQGMMQGGMTGEKEHYNESMSPCSIGQEVMMEKMQKMQGEEKGCMSCMKIKMILKNAKSLELTEDQINKIRALSTECAKNNIKKQSEIDLLKIDKKEIMMKDEVNLDEAKKILNKINEMESEKELGCIETGTKVKKLLNDKQNEKLKEMKKMMM